MLTTPAWHSEPMQKVFIHLCQNPPYYVKTTFYPLFTPPILVILSPGGAFCFALFCTYRCTELYWTCLTLDFNESIILWPHSFSPEKLRLTAWFLCWMHHPVNSRQNPSKNPKCAAVSDAGTTMSGNNQNMFKVTLALSNFTCWPVCIVLHLFFFFPGKKKFKIFFNNSQ